MQMSHELFNTFSIIEMFQVNPSPPKHSRTSDESIHISPNLDEYAHQTINDLKLRPKDVKQKQTDNVTAIDSQKHTRKSSQDIVEEKPKRTCPFYKKVPGIL